MLNMDEQAPNGDRWTVSPQQVCRFRVVSSKGCAAGMLPLCLAAGDEGGPRYFLRLEEPKPKKEGSR